MRRRDILFLCLVWGGLLAGLAWALTTQFRLVQEAKPVQVQRPSRPEDVVSPPVNGTGVIGIVSEDTREALAKDLAARKGRKPVRK